VKVVVFLGENLGVEYLASSILGALRFMGSQNPKAPRFVLEVFVKWRINLL
jgi:hypothetical protein